MIIKIFLNDVAKIRSVKKDGDPRASTLKEIQIFYAVHFRIISFQIQVSRKSVNINRTLRVAAGFFFFF